MIGAFFFKPRGLSLKLGEARTDFVLSTISPTCEPGGPERIRSPGWPADWPPYILP